MRRVAEQVCHADIKPENMLLSTEGNGSKSKHVMLCDLGMARDLRAAPGFELGYDSGTFDYWPPPPFLTHSPFCHL